MTDAQLDELIDAARPDLRIALRAILDGQAAHFFDIGEMSFANGEKWGVVCTMLAEPFAKLTEVIVGTGIAAMSESYRKVGFSSYAPKPS